MILRFWGSGTASDQLFFICCILLLTDRLIAVFPPQGTTYHQDEETETSAIFKTGEQLLIQKVPLREASLHEGKTITSSEDGKTEFKWQPSSYTTLLDALDVMESRFFAVSHGTWPHAIDWTAAVLGTQVSATLTAMTEHPGFSPATSPSLVEARDHENIINRYFTQITSFYFGENAFSLRTQAYDDMLWVVLGWLEAIKFINRHSELHYASRLSSDRSHKANHSWYAHQFIPQFAHRSRLFYDLASRGWDTTLCGGGMIWNPYLAPYKNAITNELFIAASVGMYLHFPGDRNPSPFLKTTGETVDELPPAKAHDVQYLDNAVEAYQWLKGSGMRNEQGLYVDGFHIKGWRGGKGGSNGTRQCDLRDDKVYTYNQGVLLSGLRGLWEATGSIEYLQDGHQLVRNVIAATGWLDRNTDRRWRWAGLGRNGVLEESCDWSGSCSQNAQTFKGIYFHHLTLFCSLLPKNHTVDKGKSSPNERDARLLHRKSCDEYGGWVRHNALAAYVTRDEGGVFGQWWGRSSRRRKGDDSHNDDDDDMENMERPHSEGTDYRNDGVPRDEIWRLPQDDIMYKPDGYMGMEDLRYRWREPLLADERPPHEKDINDRGRGRTVETQSGGVAVLRALWKLIESRREG